MSQLNNLYISSSYQGLLKLTDSTNGVTNTLQNIQSGDGTNTPLQISNNALNISGSGLSFTGNDGYYAYYDAYENYMESGSQYVYNDMYGTFYQSGSNEFGLTIDNEYFVDGMSQHRPAIFSANEGGGSVPLVYFPNHDNWNSGSIDFQYGLTVTGSVDIIGDYLVNGVSVLGTSGTSGTSGSDGSSGTSGTDGSSGTSGSDGSSGTSGIDGTSGSDGSSGTSGTDGTSGSDGSSGTSGSSGSDGTSGSNGTDGSSGTSGSDGTSGSNGTDGSSGTSGSDGTSGSNGTDGSSGSSGSDGSSGTSGSDGTSGSNGTDGSSGTSGSDGTSGSNGTDGSSGTSGDSLFAQTGSFWATTNDLQITGSLNVTDSGSFVSGNIRFIGDSTAPTFEIGDVSGSSPYPGMRYVIDTNVNPGNIYSYLSIDNLAEPSGSQNFGFNSNMFNGDGTKLASQIYGGGINNNGGDNTTFNMYYSGNDSTAVGSGKLDILKDTSIIGSLKVSGSIQSTAGFGQVELLTNQTLPSSVDTVITFNNDEFDPSGWYNSEYFYYQPFIAGIYQISYSVNFEPATAGAGQVNVQITKDNGMDINQLAINQHELNLLSNTSLTGTVFAQFDGISDKLYLTAYSSVGQDVNGGNGTYLNIKLL